jgi:hypothetical protein
MTFRPLDWIRALSPLAVAKYGLGLFLLTQPCGAQESPAPSPRAADGIGRMEKTLEGERAIRVRIDKFFVALAEEKSTDAFAGLLKGSPLDANQEEIGRLVQKTEELLKLSGAIRSHELLRVNRLGSRLLRLTYLSYSDALPLHWELYCFLGKTGWQVLDLNASPRIKELFDDSSIRRSAPLTPPTR